MGRVIRFILDWSAALVLAWFFGLAAVLKLTGPIDFADQITGFDLSPLFLVAPAAIMLPGVELCAALALLIPPFRRSAALLLSSLLIVFILAALSVIARGLDVPCGCFGPSGRMVGWTLVFQDLGLLFASLWLLVPTGHVRLQSNPSTPIEPK